jgi:hypothetical protein
MRTEVRHNWFSFLRRLLPGRYLYAVSLALVLSTSFVHAQENIIELTNADVLAMVRDKLPSDAIIAKIQTSLCHFDTFPTVISELRYKGVPEEILVAMVAAPIGRATKSIEDTTSKKAAARREVPPDGSTSTPSAPRTNVESAKITESNPKSLAGSKTAVTRLVTVPAKEKTGVDPVTSAGKATLPAVKVTPKTEKVIGSTASATVGPTLNTKTAPVPSAQKQNGETISATLPLPEPVKVESGIFANRNLPKIDIAVAQPAPINVGPEPTEKRVSAPTNSVPTGPPKQADTTSQVLTNIEIIKLLRSGSSITSVVAAIKAAPGNYDLSAKALLDLRDAGADASVFLSMMEINQKAIHTKSARSTNNESVPPKKPEEKKD